MGRILRRADRDAFDGGGIEGHGAKARGKAEPDAEFGDGAREIGPRRQTKRVAEDVGPVERRRTVEREHGRQERGMEQAVRETQGRLGLDRP